MELFDNKASISFFKVEYKYNHSGTVKKGNTIDETCHIESLNCLQKIVDILTLLVAYELPLFTYLLVGSGL